MGYLISETTKEEREAIVAESLGNIEATCDGCMSGLAEMYQDYIDGKKELREINMEFNAFVDAWSRPRICFLIFSEIVSPAASSAARLIL